MARTVALGEHGTTFGGNPLACAAANAVLRVSRRRSWWRARRSSARGSHARLRPSRQSAPTAPPARAAAGLLQALVLRDAERAAALPLRAIERGVLVNVTAGNVVRFFPALNIPEDELFAGLDVVLGLVAE